MWWPISLLSSVGELDFAAASLLGMKTARVTLQPAATGNACCATDRSGWHRRMPRQESLEPSGEAHVGRPHTGHGAPQSDAIIC